MKNKRILQTAGLKSTEARLALINLLKKENDPLDAFSILNNLHSEGVKADQATIYRILEILTQKGVIKRLEFGEGKYRYELQKNHHHHLICSSCGKIEDVEGEYLKNLENQIRNKKGFLVKSHSLEFFGLCRNCQS